jgi:hypothetical protein
MGQDPSQLREELEVTRARVGEEVDALSYKTDVGARVGDYVSEKKDAVTSKLTKPIPDREQIRQARRVAERNPLGLAVGAAGVGFALGLLLPGTRMENEKLGAAGDKVGEVAREGWEHGKQVAQDTAQGAMAAAKDSTSRHGEELSSSLQERLPAGEGQAAEPEQPKKRQPKSA